ncbi:Uncharacterized protein FKW44_020299 [Caligus rogercresseyi]|uniref:C2H2-type domain-containing protein n=1 Tax=Caligus rogercresseyi TaxID=217165 RepID=A0A7T8GXL3_CALRO|nr:Uncharacterized protein FKW44_020299 [Caligus rogercresseyi]
MGSMSDLCGDIRSRYDLLSCESVTKKDGSVFILIRSSIAEQSNYLPHLNAVIDSGVVKLLSYHGRILQEEDAKESQILKQLNEGKLFLCLGIQETLDDSALKNVYSEPASDGSILYRSRGCSFYMENSLGPCANCQAFQWAFEEIQCKEQSDKVPIDETEDGSMPDQTEDEEFDDYDYDDNDEDWKEPKITMRIDSKNSPKKVIKRTYVDYSRNCEICLAKFNRKYAYDRHIRLHSTLMNLEESIECPICKISLTNRLHLNDHVKETHETAKGSCGICWKMLPRAKLTRHLSNHHKEATKKLLCPECGQKFNFPFELKYHIARYHDNGGEEYVVCEQCGKGLPHKRALKMHIQRVHEKNQTFPCLKCSKVFHLNFHLKKHLQIHSKVKPFKCALCNNCCARKDHVRAHIRRVHKREPCQGDVLLVSEETASE